MVLEHGSAIFHPLRGPQHTQTVGSFGVLCVYGLHRPVRVGTLAWGAWRSLQLLLR